MKRRTFIAGLGSAAAWPVVARAQQPDRVRQIGVLTPFVESDPVIRANLMVFRETLRKLGWVEGRNIRIDYRWGPDGNRLRAYAEENPKGKHGRHHYRAADFGLTDDAIAERFRDYYRRFPIIH